MSFCVTEPSLAFDAVIHALLAVIRQPTVAKDFHLECAARSEVSDISQNAIIGERERKDLATLALASLPLYGFTRDCGLEDLP